MTTKIRKTPKRFIISAGNPADGIDLPEGTYPGYSKELGVSMLGGLKWSSPTYHLVLSQQALASIPGMENLVELEVHITGEVHAGTITVI